jgi:hypothetical protein
VRTASCVVACALVALLASAAPAQTIDVSLNVHYAIDTDINSGGTWEVVAKSEGLGNDFGIHSLSLRLTNITPAVEFEAPFGEVNGSDDAGFWITANVAQTGHRNVILSQAAIPPAMFNPGDEQSLFYGVGTEMNGMPGDVGPAFTSLTNLQNAPWAPVPPGDAFGMAEWDTAASFASGIFGNGVTPGFFAGTTGQVFTTLGTSTMPGDVQLATISTIVRTNASALPGDYNEDGKVDAADYVLWRSDPPSYGGDPQGYIDWVNNFGAMVGSGSGGAVGFAVAEPASSLLLALSAALWLWPRRGRVV